ncbi:MAG TPA: hypothetical protein V6D08_19480 [Candidatus Obscuribacterales bacterium]
MRLTVLGAFFSASALLLLPTLPEAKSDIFDEVMANPPGARAPVQPMSETNVQRMIAARRIVCQELKCKNVEVSSGITLKDQSGKTRAQFGTDRSGKIGMALLDGGGEPRFAATVSEDGLLSAYFGAPKHLLASFSVSEHGVLIALQDRTGQPRISILAAHEGRPQIGLSDAKGVMRVAVELADDGTPSLSLFDDQAKTRAVLGASHIQAVKTGEQTRTAESSLVLFDKTGAIIGSFPER